MKVKNWAGGDISSPVAIGIDPSLTNFAMVAVTLDGTAFTGRLLQSNARGAERLCEIQDHMADFILEFPEITDVAMEGTVRMSAAASVLGELSGAVKSYLFRHFGELAPLNVPPMTLKRFINGPGKGVSKSQILLSCYKKWDVELDDDNIADAYGLARIAGQVAGTTYEREVLTRLKDPKFRT